MDELAARRRRHEPRTQIPSQSEYEMNEAREFHRHMESVEKASLNDRKESCANFLYAMQHNPAIIGERVGWLLDGNYGYGAMKAAKRVVAGSARSNKVAQLTHIIAAFEWQCPPRMAVASWKKLSAEQKKALDDVVVAEIKTERE